MKFLGATPLVLACLAFSGYAQAESWSTTFDGTGGLNGTFTSVTPNSLSGSSADKYLTANGSSDATFTFTLANATRFFYVTFEAADRGESGNALLAATLKSGASTQTVSFASPANGTNPETSYSYYFGTEGSPWAAGTYTLTFSNGGGNTPFSLDNVSVSTVPEPTAGVMALAGLAVAGFISTRRRRSI